MSRPTCFDVSWELDLLKACLEWPDDQPTHEALSTVQPSCFMVGANRNLWDIMLKVAGEKGALDAAAVFTAMRKDNRFTEAERAELGELIFRVGTGALGSAEAPAQALREAWLRRQLARLSGALAHKATDFMIPMAELEREAIALGDLGTSQGDREDLRERSMADQVDLYLSGAPLMDSRKGENLLRLGLPTLDQAMQAGPGAFVVMAAKTSAGKTSLAVQALVESQAAGIQSAIISLEMDSEEVGARIIANAARVPSWSVLKAQGQPRRADDRVQAARRILRITKVPGRHFAAITAKVRQLVRRHGVRLVVIDYFTLMNPPDLRSSASVAYQLGEMSKGLKALAVDLGICILLVSQLNRSVKDGDRPTLEGLRETGQLEQDANVVLMLWTNDANPDPTRAIRLVHVELAKNRGGARWVRTKSEFNPSVCTFTEVTESAAPPEPQPDRYL